MAVFAFLLGSQFGKTAQLNAAPPLKSVFQELELGSLQGKALPALITELLIFPNGLGRIDVGLQGGFVRINIEDAKTIEASVVEGIQNAHQFAKHYENLYLSPALFPSHDNQMIDRIRIAAEEIWDHGALRNSVHNFTTPALIDLIAEDREKAREAGSLTSDKAEKYQQILADLHTFYFAPLEFKKLYEQLSDVVNLNKLLHWPALFNQLSAPVQTPEDLQSGLQTLQRIRHELASIKTAVNLNFTELKAKPTLSASEAKILYRLIAVDIRLSQSVFQVMARSNSIATNNTALGLLFWHMAQSGFLKSHELEWALTVLEHPPSVYQANMLREIVLSLNSLIYNRVEMAQLPEQLIMRGHRRGHEDVITPVEPKKVADNLIRSSLIMPLATAIENYAAANDLNILVRPFTDPVIQLNPARELRSIAGRVYVVRNEADLQAITAHSQNSDIVILLLNEALQELPKADLVISVGKNINSSSHLAMLLRNGMVPHLHVDNISADLVQALLDKPQLDVGFQLDGQTIDFLDPEKTKSLLKKRKKEKDGGQKQFKLKTYQPPKKKSAGVHTLHEIAEAPDRYSGGKAAGLAELLLMNPTLPVPDGLVLSFEFFDNWIGSQNEPLTKLWKKIKEGQASKAERAKFVKNARLSQIPDDLMTPVLEQTKAVQTKLGRLITWFVRSTSNSEDGNFNAAGVNKTLAGIPWDREKLEHAIKDVLLSPFEDRAQTWYQRIFTNPQNIRSSALLMPSIDGDFSSVMEIEPVTDNKLRLRVSTQLGLGENVVGGKGTSELIFLEVDLTTGKTTQFFARPARGKQSDLIKLAGKIEPDVVEERILEAPHIRQIIALAKILRNSWKNNQERIDVELTFLKEMLFLLQARRAPENDGYWPIFAGQPRAKLATITTPRGLKDFDLTYAAIILTNSIDWKRLSHWSNVELLNFVRKCMSEPKIWSHPFFNVWFPQYIKSDPFAVFFLVAAQRPDQPNDIIESYLRSRISDKDMHRLLLKLLESKSDLQELKNNEKFGALFSDLFEQQLALKLANPALANVLIDKYRSIDTEGKIVYDWPLILTQAAFFPGLVEKVLQQDKPERMLPIAWFERYVDDHPLKRKVRQLIQKDPVSAYIEHAELRINEIKSGIRLYHPDDFTFATFSELIFTSNHPYLLEWFLAVINEKLNRRIDEQRELQADFLLAFGKGFKTAVFTTLPDHTWLLTKDTAKIFYEGIRGRIWRDRNVTDMFMALTDPQKAPLTNILNFIEMYYKVAKGSGRRINSARVTERPLKNLGVFARLDALMIQNPTAEAGVTQFLHDNAELRKMYQNYLKQNLPVCRALSNTFKRTFQLPPN